MPRILSSSPISDGDLCAPTLRQVDLAKRNELLAYYDRCRNMRLEWLRRQIVVNDRIDILATQVLGYEVKPFHLAMLRLQFLHAHSMNLVFRGAGKSTICTITKIIHLLVKDRDLRILIASKTSGNAEAFLKEIKSHLEDNVLLIELFGKFYDAHQVCKWDTREIEVLGRKRKAKESSITCASVGSQVVGKHFDCIFSDDLVDEDNSRTMHMRERTKTWFYQTLDPCLEPPDPEVPHRGEHHILGTRYHYDDLMGHLQKHELKEAHQVIPALDERERSPWPEKFPPSWFHKKRERAGTIIFNAQYQCDTAAMQGEVFQYDHCQIVDDSQIPEGLRMFIGVDLAIGEKEQHDLFALVVLGLCKQNNRYVIEYVDGHLRFSEQTKTILKYYRRHDPVRLCIEANAYQAAQYQTLKDEDKDLRIVPVYTDKDKITRAWKLSSLFEEQKFHFRRGLPGRLLDQIVLFPNYRYKDGFDALDLANHAIKLRSKRRRRRDVEPGLL